MRFIVVDSFPNIRVPLSVYLVRDNWNDWYSFRTMRTLVFVGADGQALSIGSTKIGRRGMVEKSDTVVETLLPAHFERLDETYFSVGQSENFYESLNELDPSIRSEILLGLNDCALTPLIFEQNREETVMSRSLMRDVSEATLRARYQELAHGRAQLTPFAFDYQFAPLLDGTLGPTLHFEVHPDSMPPSNVHVLIGRNGVGKSRCFDHLARSLLGDGSVETVGAVTDRSTSPSPWTAVQAPFSGIVFVAFSAFDAFRPLAEEDRPSGIKYSYIGLKQRGSGEEELESLCELKSQSDITHEFLESVRACQVGARRVRWAELLEVLEADPLFSEQELSRISAVSSDLDELARYFNRLSSGHRIVLLIATRLVELVEERTLVLIDEPEGHLHPPLLAALVRSLSILLANRNGVALIATHSPVVLQEVPRLCSWVLNRSGAVSRVDRPGIETFGENVGVLTREVFSLEVYKSGYVGLIREKAEAAGFHYEQTLAVFGGMLGAEGRAIARAICAAHVAQ